MGSLHNNIHLIGPTLFLLYINDFSDVIGIYQLSNQWQQLDVIYRTLWAGAESALLISILKKFNWFCLTSAIDVRMYGLVIVEKSAFRIMGLTFSYIGLGLLLYPYCKNCLQENWNLDFLYEVSLSRSCTISL